MRTILRERNEKQTALETLVAAKEREQLELREEMDALRGKGSEVDAHSEQVRSFYSIYWV